MDRAAPPGRRVGRAGEAACYAAGFLALGLVPMQAVTVPLWALELGAAPAEIGMAVAMRSLGPMLFAIHGGALMDRFGAKAVMLRMGAVCLLACLAYPLLPSVAALMALQALFGLAQGLSWVGAQTLIGQWTRGDPTMAGRLSAASLLGTFAGPILAGLAWDAGGAWGGFGAMALWSGALVSAAAILPRRRQTAPPGARRLRDIAPDPADYRAAVALLAAPAMAALMIGSFARLGAIAVQGSFYPVYVASLGFDATFIGALLGVASLLGAGAALLAGPLDRRAPPLATMTVFIAISVVAIAATPLVSTAPALIVLALVFGASMGVSQAQVLAMLGKAAPPEKHGLAVGLRTTFNRAGSFVTPVALGGLAGALGLTAGFLVSGALLLAATGAMALLARRARI